MYLYSTNIYVYTYKKNISLWSMQVKIGGQRFTFWVVDAPRIGSTHPIHNMQYVCDGVCGGGEGAHFY